MPRVARQVQGHEDLENDSLARKRLVELEQALAEATSDVRFAEKRLAEAVEETA
jgi:hypothetical protein